MIRRLECLAAQLSGEETGLEIEFRCLANDLISYPCNETVKTLHMKATRLSGPSWLVNTLMSCEGNVPGLQKDRAWKLCVPFLPILALCFSSFALDLSQNAEIRWMRLFLWLVLTCILDNKTIILSTFPECCGSF